MKDLIIPDKVENAVNLTDIDVNFTGLIITYKGNEASGYINWYGDEWGYYTSMNSEDPYYTCNTLKECIDWIISTCNATNFKVIEFK